MGAPEQLSGLKLADVFFGRAMVLPAMVFIPDKDPGHLFFPNTRQIFLSVTR
jgi:hypothetical protein